MLLLISRSSKPTGLCTRMTYPRADMHVMSPHKLVIVVRKDLGMSTGKIAAQCAHAAVNAYKEAEKKKLLLWSLNGQQKVILKCPDEATLLELHKKAKNSGLVSTLICDSGRTQVSPGTYTVLGIGPGPCDKIDFLTGHLKLF